MKEEIQKLSAEFAEKIATIVRGSVLNAMGIGTAEPARTKRAYTRKVKPTDGTAPTVEKPKRGRPRKVKPAEAPAATTETQAATE